MNTVWIIITFVLIDTAMTNLDHSFASALYVGKCYTKNEHYFG